MCIQCCMGTTWLTATIFSVVAACAGCGSSSSGGGESADAGSDVGVLDSGGAQDAASSGTVGTLGAMCSPPGTLACAGHLQKLQLLCDASGHWIANGTCSGSQICDAEPGINAGTCQDPLGQCAGKKPGDTFCTTGMGMLGKCGPDLITATTTACPMAMPACFGGACVLCAPFVSACINNTPSRCAGDGTSWQQTGPSCTGMGNGFCGTPEGCPSGRVCCY